MSVLFCRWAVAEEEEESEDVSVKSSEQVSDDVLGESDIIGKEDTNTSCSNILDMVTERLYLPSRR